MSRASRLQGFAPLGNPYPRACCLHGLRADALLVFILPRAFPAQSAERPSPLDPLTRFRRLPPSRVLVVLRLSALQTRRWLCLSRERQPFRGFSPGSTRLFEDGAALGYGFPSVDPVRYRPESQPLHATAASARAQRAIL